MYALDHRTAPALSARLPKSYEEAAALLGGRTSKKLANNTYLVAREVPGGEGSRRINDGIEYAVTLHRTDVVTFVSKSETRLNSGNYQTPTTTRSRMRASGFPVYMGGGIATVAPDGDPARQVTFADGMMIVRHEGKPAVIYHPTENVRPPADALWMRREDLRKDPGAWRWPNRSGGRGYERGNAPQAFWKLP